MNPFPTARGRRRATALASLGLAAGLALAACGGDDDSEDTSGSPIAVTDAWARTSPMEATAGAVYLTITNNGEADDALIAAAVDDAVAATAELHETRAAAGDADDGHTATTADGMETAGSTPAAPMMEMVPVERIDVPAGGAAQLRPGGFHIMLLEMPAPLEAGSSLELTLTFEHAGEVAVDAVVGDAAP